MSKRKKKQVVEDAVKTTAKDEPKRTHIAFVMTYWAIIAGFVAQLIMAAIVYPFLPDRIPSYWAGSLIEGDAIPSWMVFVFFPFAQIVLFLIAKFSPKNEEGKYVMESGKAATLLALTALFIALQASAFRLTI